MKDTIFSQEKLQCSKVSVIEDFSKAHRNSRRKVLEFGKNSGQPFSLQVNKLYINKVAYAYCPVNERVCEHDTREARSTDNLENAPCVPVSRAGSWRAPSS